MIHRAQHQHAVGGVFGHRNHRAQVGVIRRQHLFHFACGLLPGQVRHHHFTGHRQGNAAVGTHNQLGLQLRPAGKIDGDLVAAAQPIFLVGRRLKLPQRLHRVGLQLWIGRLLLFGGGRRGSLRRGGCPPVPRTRPPLPPGIEKPSKSKSTGSCFRSSARTFPISQRWSRPVLAPEAQHNPARWQRGSHCLALTLIPCIPRFPWPATRLGHLLWAKKKKNALAVQAKSLESKPLSHKQGGKPPPRLVTRRNILQKAEASESNSIS